MAAFLSSSLARFEPWQGPDGRSPQAELITAFYDSKKVVYRAGNKTGKTYGAAATTLFALLGWHPAQNTTGPEGQKPTMKKPPLIAWASALDWEWGIGDDLWPAFQALLPMDQVRSIQWYRKGAPSIPRTIVFKNDSRLIFKSAESGRKKYQGTAIDWLFVNEEHPSDVVREARRGMVTRGGVLLCSLTPVERAKWVQELEREPGTVVIRASLTAASMATVKCPACQANGDPHCDRCSGTGILPIADREAVESFLGGLPEAQRAMRDLGDYAIREGLVWPNFCERSHVAFPHAGALWARVSEQAECKKPVATFGGERWGRVCDYPISKSVPRYASMDFGFSHPAAVIRGAHFGDVGRLVIERCWYAQFIRHSTWAAILKAVLGPLAAPIVCDWDADGRAELEQAGIPTSTARKNVNAGLELVGQLWQLAEDGLPRMLILQDPSLEHPTLGRCDGEKLLWEIPQYRYPEDLEGKAMRADRPIKRDDDACDALRYLAVEVAVRAQQRGSLSRDVFRRLGVRMP